MSCSRWRPLSWMLPAYSVIARVLHRAEQLALHHLGEAEDGVERRAQLVAHGGEEARLGDVGGLRAPARLVGDRFLLLDLGDQRVLLGAELEHGQRRGVEPLGQEDEVDVQADRHGRHRHIERVALHDQAGAHRHGHRDGADVEDRHDRGGERHADRQQDDERGQDEDVADGVRRPQPDHGHAAPGDAGGQARATRTCRASARRCTSPRGAARNLRQAAIMKNFMEMTAASQAEACTTGAQNIEASEKMTASSGMVTRADSSFFTNIASSSYSNSGFSTVPCERRARSSRMCASRAARGSFARGRCGRAGGGVAAVASSPSPGTRPMQIDRGSRLRTRIGPDTAISAVNP